MEHDLEDGVPVGEKGKKRNRGVMDDFLANEETTDLEGRNRRVGEVIHLLSAAAKRHANRLQ